MGVTADDIRDTLLAGIALSYDWERSQHSVELRFQAMDGTLRAFRVSGLTRFDFAEDFSNPDITHCSLFESPDRIYLSLDPYLEDRESNEDGFVIVGRSISRVE